MVEPLLIESQFPITDRSKLQLFSLGTPNGIKISLALEELGIPYEAHRVNIMKGDQFTDAYKSTTQNPKTPAIVDFNGPGGKPLALMESGAILIYLAERAGRLIPTDPEQRLKCLQWLFFQVGHIGPMFGQFGHFFKYAKDKCDHPYPVERYTTETKRLLGVLEAQLTGREYLLDEYSIADIATVPWVHALDWAYGAKDVISLADYPNVLAWVTRVTSRPAYAIAKEVPK